MNVYIILFEINGEGEVGCFYHKNGGTRETFFFLENYRGRGVYSRDVSVKLAIYYYNSPMYSLQVLFHNEALILSTLGVKKP